MVTVIRVRIWRSYNSFLQGHEIWETEAKPNLLDQGGSYGDEHIDIKNLVKVAQKVIKEPTQ